MFSDFALYERSIAARQGTKNTPVYPCTPLGCSVECLWRGKLRAPYSTSSTELNDLAFRPSTFVHQHPQTLDRDSRPEHHVFPSLTKCSLFSVHYTRLIICSFLVLTFFEKKQPAPPRSHIAQTAPSSPLGVVWREPEAGKSRGGGGYGTAGHPFAPLTHSLTHYTTAKLTASRYSALPLDISTFPPRQTRPEMTSHIHRLIQPTKQPAKKGR